jgi:hypothetical protein
MQFLSHSKSKGVDIQAGYLISKLSKALSAFLACKQTSKEEIPSPEVGFNSNNGNTAWK